MPCIVHKIFCLQLKCIYENGNDCSYLIVPQGGEILDFSESYRASGKTLLYNFKLLLVDVKFSKHPSVKCFIPLS